MKPCEHLITCHYLHLTEARPELLAGLDGDSLVRISAAHMKAYVASQEGKFGAVGRMAHEVDLAVEKYLETHPSARP